ncbi:hypothetical protein PsorP6_001350 [Peronosclerospora sorghi]|uniref:Uncharacterized protein n=1 Tax=Peronosclerospora sorghi TaxID=230839 RepID=A0ACC0WYU0_9STRA|nr:hypothetical protein PsorP6_001350 [Peronosclerospora sorghi]
MSAHPRRRRLNSGEKATVYSLTAAGVPTRQILVALRQKDESCLDNAKTIYNAKSKYRQEQIAGRTPINALLEDLQEKEVTHSLM